MKHKCNWKNFKIFNLHYNYHVFPFAIKLLLIDMIMMHPWFMPTQVLQTCRRDHLCAQFAVPRVIMAMTAMIVGV